MLFVALEGQRQIAIDESVYVDGSALYCVYAVAVGSRFVTRASDSLLQALPGAACSASPGALSIQPPAVVVLIHNQSRSCNRSSWTPWPQVLRCCTQVTQIPHELATQTFQLRLASVNQYDTAKRSRRASVWEEVDAVGEIFDLPNDARISTLQQKLAARLQIPVSWQLILKPIENLGEQSWQYLLPNARVIDYAVNVGDGPLVLVFSVQKDAGQWLQRNPTLYQQPASTFLTFPWIPVLCSACLDRQVIPLDTLLFDARRPLSSYAARVARRVEEEMGPRAYCTTFAVYELVSATSSSGGTWRALQMGAPIATELRHTGQGTSNACELIHLLWEALPLAPSMTGRAWFAAQDAACLPDAHAKEKHFPLERLADRKKEEIGLALFGQPMLGEPTPQADVDKTPSFTANSDAEEYSALLVLEERLLVAWVEDATEAITELTFEARRHIDAMVARLAVLAPDEAPPGLKEWPTEPIAQWSCRAWEKICRGASSLQVWATPGPDATEDEIMRNLLWAEVSTLQEIVLSLDAIRFTRQGRVALGNGQQPGSKPQQERFAQVALLGTTVSDVVEAERTYFTALLASSELDEFFSGEVEDLPSECDSDIGCLHAFVQTTNAELNSVWLTQRQQILSNAEAQLWRIVRLRELALSSLFLLIKQTQGTKVVDGVFLEWLQQVQYGCRLIIQKSRILCEATSAVAGLPRGGEAAIIEAVEQLTKVLEDASSSLQLLHQGNEKSEDLEAVDLKQVEEQLATCDMHSLSGNLVLLALERQLESSVSPASRRLSAGMRKVRQGLHSLTLKTMLIRARFDLPLDDASATFTSESQRRGRKMRVLGRTPRRAVMNSAGTQAANGQNAASLDDTFDEAAEAEAEAKAKELLKSEDLAKQKKDSKKKKQRQKRSAANNVSTAAQANVDVEQPIILEAAWNLLESAPIVTQATYVESLPPISPQEQSGVCKDLLLEEKGAEGSPCEVLVDSPVELMSEPEEEAAPDDALDEQTAEAEPTISLELVPIELLPETGFRVVRSSKEKKKKKVESPQEEKASAEFNPVQDAEAANPKQQKNKTKPDKRRSNESKRDVVQHDRRDLVQERREPAQQEKREWNHSSDAIIEAVDQVEVRVPLEKEVFDMLNRRKKSRLANIEKTCRARCFLDKSGQSVRISGTACVVAAARGMVEDLCVQWIDIADSVWAVLLSSQDSGSSHVSRLQDETHCSIVVDRDRPRIQVAGSTRQTEQAQMWLLQLSDKCQSSQVSLPSHVKSPKSLASRLESAGSCIRVSVERNQSGFMAHISGLATEVQRAIDMVNSEALPSPTRTDASTSIGSVNRTPSLSLTSPTDSPHEDIRKGRQTPSDWGGSTPRGLRDDSSELSQVESPKLGATLDSPKCSPKRILPPRPQEAPSMPESTEVSYGSTAPASSSSDISYSGAYPGMMNICPDVMPFMPGAENHHVAGSCYFMPMPMIPLGMGATAQFPQMMHYSGEMFPHGFSNGNPFCQEPHLQGSQGSPSKEDEGAKSLAARLAEKFPSARIHIGAPDAQEPPAVQEKKQPIDGLEAKMRRLRELLGESKRSRIRNTRAGLDGSTRPAQEPCLSRLDASL